MEKEEKQHISDFPAELIFGNSYCTVKEKKEKAEIQHDN